MKKMRKYLLLLLFACQSAAGLAQLTVEECHLMARDNYPLVRQYGLIGMSEGYDLKNASKSWVPQLSLSAKATWQSDVTSLPIEIPGYDIPTLARDQYQVVAEVSQVIWDGGATKASKEGIRAQGDVDRAQFEVDMYAIRERVNNLFFGILLLDEQIRLNALYLQDLQVNCDRIAGYMANGVANQADLDAVRAEQITAGQNATKMNASRSAYVRMLAAFTGRALDDGVQLVKPGILQPVTGSAANRPEMELFDAMQRRIEMQRKTINASNTPQLGLFIQGGYGRPGLNMLQNQFRTYAIGGVRLSWNIGSFYTRHSNLRKIVTGVGQVDVQRETFLFNNGLQQTQLDAEYRKYTQIMEDDDEIIRMRGNIVRASQAKLENGTISSSDLMRDMIAEQNAKVGKALHEIELLQTIYGIKNLTNN